MCQAVWRSPLLPLLPAKKDTIVDSAPRELNSGQKFKRDLLAYLEAYGNKKVKLLIQQLRKFDFQSVRAALIASVPSKQKLEDMRRSESLTPWGWPALKNVLSQIPLYKHQQGLEQERDRKSKSKAHIVIQVCHYIYVTVEFAPLFRLSDTSRKKERSIFKDFRKLRIDALDFINSFPGTD